MTLPDTRGAWWPEAVYVSLDGCRPDLLTDGGRLVVEVDRHLTDMFLVWLSEDRIAVWVPAYGDAVQGLGKLEGGILKMPHYPVIP